MAGDSGKGRTSGEARAERLAKALRANLARRKQQARARGAAGQGEKTPEDDAQKPQEDDV